MFDFDDVAAASKSEQIRAYAIERALEVAPANVSGIIRAAAAIEDYIINGKEED